MTWQQIRRLVLPAGVIWIIIFNAICFLPSLHPAQRSTFHSATTLLVCAGFLFGSGMKNRLANIIVLVVMGTTLMGMLATHSYLRDLVTAPWFFVAFWVAAVLIGIVVGATYRKDAGDGKTNSKGAAK